MTATKTFLNTATGVIREYPETFATLYPNLEEVHAAIDGCRDCGGTVVADEAIVDPSSSDDAPVVEVIETAAKPAKTKE